MKIIFDTLNSYYLPQYLPIYRQLTSRGHHASFLCYRNKDDQGSMAAVFRDMGLESHWVEGDAQAQVFYLKEKADWVIFGNAISYIDELNTVSRSVQLGHGVGPKPSYYHKSKTPMTVRFIEGDLRIEKIKALYPEGNFVQVGYSKLDPIFNGEETGLDFHKLGLDSSKPTILYAPTFNPSSLERFPNHWPEQFKDFNILIKAHGLSYNRSRYRSQRKKLDYWSAYPNVYVAKAEEVSLLPFMKQADILLSEASSTLFEFVALGKPVIVCDFYKLKWSYRGPFKYRFEKRFGKDYVLYNDIGLHAKGFKQLRALIEKQLSQPDLFKMEREKYTREHIGPVDGLASKRIVEYLEANS